MPLKIVFTTAQVHQALIETGYQIDAGELASETYGSSTRLAVEQYQEEHHLDVDGICGPKTWASLHNGGIDGRYTCSGWRYNSDSVSTQLRPVLSAAIGEIGRPGTWENPPGSNRGARIDIYSHPNEGVPWCFTGETEILTENGWLPFSSYDEKLQVAQVDQTTLKVSLTPIITKIVKEYSGVLVTVKRRSLSLTMDPSHKLFGEWAKPRRKAFKKTWSDRELYPVSDLVSKEASHVMIPTTTGTSTSDFPISDRDIKLLAAFIADGIAVKGNKEKPWRLSFQMSREWKIEELKKLEPEHIYKAKDVYGPRTKKPLTTLEFKIPTHFLIAFSDYKILSTKFIWSLSKRQAILLLNTFSNFDGNLHKGHMFVTQASKQRIDSMHHLSVLAGYSAQTRYEGFRGEFASEMFGLSYEKTGKPTKISNKHISTKEVDSIKLYCVQVPSGLIVVRPKFGKAIIVGNCAAFAWWCYRFCDGGAPYPRLLSALKIRDWGETNGKIISLSDPGRPGDIFVILRGDGHGHVGLIANVIEPGKFSTVEGNNRDAVRGSIRERGQFAAIVRPVS